MSSPYSLDNFVEKLSMQCVPQEKIGWIGASFFIGWAFTVLWVCRLADIFGRKWIFRCTLILSGIGVCLIYFIHDLDTMIILYFFLGCSSSGTCNLGFVYFMEFLPLSKHAIGATAFAVADGLVLPLCTLYFMFVGRNWAWISMVGTGLILFSLCTIWCVPESPKILVN